MALNYKTSLGVSALLPLLFSVVAAEKDPADGLLITYSDVRGCMHLDNTNFNITGSVDTGNNNAFSGKWSTGLTATPGPKANITQSFWVDTTGHDELNATQLRNSCIRIFDQIDPKDWSKADNDNGDCSSLLGSDCLQALNSAIVRAAGLGSTNACDDLRFTMPTECAVLPGSGVSFGTVWGPSEDDPNRCTTQNNENGGVNAFLSIVSKDNDYADNANYDSMAHRPYVLINNHRKETESMIEFQTDIVCMRNKDFAKDARVPDAMKPKESQTPTAGPPAPTATDKPNAASTVSTSALGMMGALAAMMFFF